MKIESRQIVSQADIKKIIQLNESVKGTSEYMKYHMEMSYKHDNTQKVVKGHVYIETFPHKDSYGTTQIERWYVTDRIMEEMGWWI